MSEGTGPAVAAGETDTFAAIRRGLTGRCPACGEGHVFQRYLKVAESCDHCGLPLHHHRADDFPPYIVMFIVGHVVGYGIYASETGTADIPIWALAIWPALTLILSLVLLQPIKGAVVGLQYGLRMHGFAEAVRTRSARMAMPDREDLGERGQGAGAEGSHDERGARETMAKPEA